MSEPKNFETVISTLAASLDELERIRQRGPKWDSTLYGLNVRLSQTYLDVCMLAAEHGNAQGQRVLEQVGRILASQAKQPHGSDE